MGVFVAIAAIIIGLFIVLGTVGLLLDLLGAVLAIAGVVWFVRYLMARRT